jgi:hypothetical protein
MGKETRVITKFKPFKLGYCACGCGESINIQTARKLLKRFVKNHDKKSLDRGYMKGENHIKFARGWNGGRKATRGYWEILMPDYFSANKNGYVFEHIYNFQEYNKCCILPWGVVHHIDENKKNNMTWNLQGMTNKQHQLLHCFKDMDGRICIRCNSDKTYLKKNGRPMWYKIGAECLCKNCYDKDPKTRNLKNKRRRDSYKKNKTVTLFRI